MQRRRTPTLEDHVRSIIKAKGPDGALRQRYNYTFLEEILSEIHSRNKLLDLRAYHFKYMMSIWNEEGVTNYALAREATGELLDVLCERNGWDYEQVIENIRLKHFEQEPIKYDGTLGGMIDRVYDCSPSRAVIDFLQNHPDKRVRKRFRDLRAYHFTNGQKNIWNLKSGKKNYELAREATGEFLDTLRKRKGWDYEDIVKNISKEHFENVRIKYGATVNGMFQVVYDNSPSKTVMDYLQNHPDRRVRKRFKDLKPYHFSKAQRHTWNLKDGSKNHKLARQATGELLDVLHKRYGWDYEQVMQNIRREHFYREKISYGATLTGMLCNVYDASPSRAIIDFLQNHPNKKVRGRFKDLGPYHFSNAQNNTWRLKSGKKNYKLAREATGELLDVLCERYGWDYEQVMQNIRKNHFYGEQIKYGANLGGMVARIYDGSPSRAVIDFLQNHPNKRVRARFKDLNLYHFGKVQNMWNLKNGRKNLRLARQATGELLAILKKRNRWSNEQVIQNIRREHFYRQQIGYGATLTGMLSSVYGYSYKDAVWDYMRHKAA